MILNAYLEGVIALLLGAAFVVVAKVYSLPEFSTTGTMMMGAGAGYILRELGPETPPPAAKS